MDKAACKLWLQRKRTMYGNVTHMKSHQGAPHLTAKPGSRRTLAFSTPTLWKSSLKECLQAAHEATVSRPRNAGPSEESD